MEITGLARYYRSLIDGLEEALLVASWPCREAPGHFVDFNEAACRLTGYTCEELSSMGLGDLLGKNYVMKISELAVDETSVGGTLLLAKNGKVVPVEIKARQIIAGGQRLVMVTAREINEIGKDKELADDRRRNEQMLATISRKLVCFVGELDVRIPEVLRDLGEFLAVDCCFVIMDNYLGTQGEVTHFWSRDNDGCEAVFSVLSAAEFCWALKEFGTGNYLAISSPDELPPEAQNEKRFMERFGLKAVLVVRVALAENIMSYLGLGMTDGDNKWDIGRIPWLTTVAELIITSVERMRFFEAINQRQKEREALLDAIPDLKFRISRDGLVIAAQAGEYDPFRPLNEQVGQYLSAIFPRELANRYLGSVRRAIDSREVQVFTFRIRVGEDTQFREARAVAYNEEEAIVLVRDVTKQRVAEMENVEAHRLLEQAQTMASLGVVATMIAHEINQPLNAIKVSANGAIYVAKQKIRQTKAELLREFEAIAAQADRIDAIIKSIRALVRRDSSRRAPVKLPAVVERSIGIVADQPLFRDVLCDVQIDDELPVVYGSSLHYEQVVINLLQNAAQSLATVSKCEKKIAVTAWRRAEGVMLEVSDNGPGIGEEDLPRLFEPFSSRRISVNNMGLGLAIVQNIVDAYGGSVRAYNNPSGGATFQIFFPAGQEGVRQAASSVTDAHVMSDWHTRG